MHWLAIITVSYFILAVSNTADKIFLSRIVTESIVYALWVSMLSIVAVGIFTYFWHFNEQLRARFHFAGELTAMNPGYVTLAIGIGILFTLAIYFLYTALQKGEASRVIPVIGGSMPLLIYAMTVSYEPLPASKVLALIFLVAGTVLISVIPKSGRNGKNRYGLLLALAASVTFSLFFVLSHYLFGQQGFINGIVWPRLGSALAVIFLLLTPGIRRRMYSAMKALSGRVRVLWITIQSIGALGFLGQNYVISLPDVSVALVSALQGMQYVFILVFASALSITMPTLLREYVSPLAIAQKVMALVLIGVGLYYVSL